MPYVNVPNDLSKIKTKMAFNLTKRQLVCFGSAGAVGIPAYLLIRTYRTENIYAPFAGPGAGKEDVIEKHKEEKRSRRQG